jgi:phage repressor protein C with HTH and peptisase S24 domain
MAPTLLDGDTVIAKIYEGDGTDIPNKKVVIVANPDGELYVKRLFKADGKFILLSDNPSYPPIYPEEGYRVIGIAIEYYRKGKL